MRRFLLLLLIAVGCIHASHAQQVIQPTRLLLLIDCSESMWEPWQSDTKMKVAQRALTRWVDSLPYYPNIQIGLRTIGCTSGGEVLSRIEMPFPTPPAASKSTQRKEAKATMPTDALRGKLKALVPMGANEASSQSRKAWNDFPSTDDGRNIVLVVAHEATLGNPSMQHSLETLHNSNNVVQTFVVVVGESNSPATIQPCDSAMRILHVAEESRLHSTLCDVLRQSAQQARVAISLLDAQGKPYATDVPMVFYDRRTHALKLATVYHYSQTDPPDTLTLDPLINYDITLFTHPAMRIERRRFVPDKCNPLTIPMQQGSLRLYHEARRIPFDLPKFPALVRRHGETAVLATQTTDQTLHYRAGYYDIEVLTLPITRLDNVEIRGGTSTDLQLPLPGQLALTKPAEPTTGALFVVRDGVQEWVCDLDPTQSDERIVLIPGQYLLLLRRQSTGHTSATPFTIKSALQTGIAIEK